MYQCQGCVLIILNVSQFFPCCHPSLQSSLAYPFLYPSYQSQDPQNPSCQSWIIHFQSSWDLQPSQDRCPSFRFWIIRFRPSCRWSWIIRSSAPSVPFQDLSFPQFPFLGLCFPQFPSLDPQSPSVPFLGRCFPLIPSYQDLRFLRACWIPYFPCCQCFPCLPRFPCFRSFQFVACEFPWIFVFVCLCPHLR